MEYAKLTLSITYFTQAMTGVMYQTYKHVDFPLLTYCMSFEKPGSVYMLRPINFLKTFVSVRRRGNRKAQYDILNHK